MRSRSLAAVLEHFEQWYFAQIPARRLRQLRMVIGGFVTLYLAVRLPFFMDLTDNVHSRWDPVGVLTVFDQPWPDIAVRALIVGSLCLAALYTSGLWFRAVAPSLTVSILVLFTYRSSWGQLLHFENLMLLQIGILSLAAAGRRTSPSPRDHDVAAGWPIRLMTIVTALTYVLAGWSKLRFGGASWLFGDTLRNHVASATVRRELLGQSSSPVGRWLVGQAWIFPPLAIATVAIELSALVALGSRTFRNIWVAATWLMHAGIAATMLIVFPMPFFGVAFVSFFAIPASGNTSRESPQ